MEKKTKKKSVAKKLIPATSMLLVSATMLASSTYAWFTMSKEVSLTGIQMTASVPEDIQISLGLGTSEGTGNYSLKKDDNTAASFTSNACDVGAPKETAGTTDWSNTIPVGSYYTFGHLTPATSVSGTNIFYTHDATGVGKTIREDNSGVGVGYGQAGYTTFTQAAANDAGVADPTSAKAQATADDKTGGKYYIDIPVWFRTSVKGSGNVNLAVMATFSDPGSDNGTPSIVKAARVALLDTASSNASAGVICDASTSYYHTYASTTLTDADTAVFTSGSWATNIASITAATTVSGTTGTNTWGNVDFVKQATDSSLTSEGLAASTDDTVVTVPLAGDSADWGNSHKYILRVWLEGEDVNCWNETAAQDFQIDLRFIRKATA